MNCVSCETCVYHLWFIRVFPWGTPQLQSEWSLSCDHGLDHASKCKKSNKITVLRRTVADLPIICTHTEVNEIRVYTHLAIKCEVRQNLEMLNQLECYFLFVYYVHPPFLLDASISTGESTWFFQARVVRRMHPYGHGTS